MTDLTDVDQRFRHLQDGAIHAYEEKLKRNREKHEHSSKRLSQREEQVREIMRASQLDLGRLDHFIEEDEAALQDFLREMRPGMLEYPTSRAQDAKRLSLSSGLQSANSKIISVYAATLLASGSANLEGNAGEWGNPWVLPLDPSQVKIKGSETGRGFGCLVAKPSVFSDSTAIFWFPFIPATTGTWYLNALINLHGFYILRANDTFFTCKESAAFLEAIVDIYQYYWTSPKHFPLINIDQDNISDIERADIYGEFDYTVGLGEGDLAWVRVMINLHTFATGGGSYSEINFSNGTANYIEPLIVVAAPPTT